MTPHFTEEKPEAQRSEVTARGHTARKWQRPRALTPSHALLAWKVPETRPGVCTSVSNATAPLPGKHCSNPSSPAQLVGFGAYLLG